jgi:Site-specific recombinase XerD
LDELREYYVTIKSKNAFTFDDVDYDKYYKYQFKPLLKELGFSSDIRFHDSRHSHASFLLAAGVDVKQISHQLGHAKIGTTFGTYTHLLKTDEVSSKLGSLLEDRFTKNPKKLPKNP